jgi:hypothetical protein
MPQLQAYLHPLLQWLMMMTFAAVAAVCLRLDQLMSQLQLARLGQLRPCVLTPQAQRLQQLALLHSASTLLQLLVMHSGCWFLQLIVQLVALQPPVLQ